MCILFRHHGCKNVYCPQQYDLIKTWFSAGKGKIYLYSKENLF